MTEYKCNVRNCGNGKCIHKLTDIKCPLCGKLLIKVTTTGLLFCPEKNPYVCDYHEEAGNDK